MVLWKKPVTTKPSFLMYVIRETDVTCQKRRTRDKSAQWTQAFSVCTEYIKHQRENVSNFNWPTTLILGKQTHSAPPPATFSLGGHGPQPPFLCHCLVNRECNSFARKCKKMVHPVTSPDRCYTLCLKSPFKSAFDIVSMVWRRDLEPLSRHQVGNSEHIKSWEYMNFFP